jgi:EmrB/QacA subfamily drug resistance transporter
VTEIFGQLGQINTPFPRRFLQMTSPLVQPSFLGTRRGKLTLALLCAIAFLDFVDASIVNIALPDIRTDLHFSVQGLQWVLSGYLLTYGGFMLLGGRAGDLLGRRRVLVTGTTVFAISSLIGGFAGSAGVLVGARFAQGLGAALMLPAALSLLTTSFKEGKDRNTALGVWGGMAGLASAAGVFLGGVLTEGPGWRWVLFVNPPIAVILLGAIFWLIPGERHRAPLANFDLLGTVLVTGGMLLLVFALVKAPDQGWGSARTIGELVGAGVLLAAFVLNEQRSRNPLVPLSIFRVPGLAAADITQLVGVAGFLAMFFFLTLYMQNVLGYSPLQTGAAYLPLTIGVAFSAGISSQLLTKVGTRPMIVGGALIVAGGLFYLSRAPVDGSYLTDLFPGLMIVSLGVGAMFVAVTTAANAGVPADKAGLAAALLNSSQQVGAALGLAVLSAIATARTNHLLATHASPAHALTSGFHRALLVGSIVVLATAIIAVRTSNSRGETDQPVPQEDAALEPAVLR